MKKALIITRVSGFLPQFEMNNVKILTEMGYEIHYAANFNTVVYGSDNSRLDGTDIIQHQIDFERSPSPVYVLKALKQVKRLLLEGNFDLIHVHMPMSSVIVRMAAESVRKKTGRHVPVIYTAHGLHFYTGAPLKNWIYYPVEKHLAKYTDRLILINQEDYDRARAKFKVRGKIERTMGIGMDLSRFENYRKTNWKVDGSDEVEKAVQSGHELTLDEALNDGRKEDIHDHKAPAAEGHVQDTPDAEDMKEGLIPDIYDMYQIPRSHAILISVGELTNRKNNIVMIRAMKELLDLPVTYLIVGSGPLESYLMDVVDEEDLSERVKFAGYVNGVEKLLVQADCFVFPSFQEGLPVAVMEAMAVGLPVIATKIRGITDLIEHTKGGYLVNTWEPEDYAVKVRRMFTDRDGKSNIKRDVRRREMGEWNREHIKNFSIEVVDKKMRKIYADVEKDFDINDK